MTGIQRDRGPSPLWSTRQQDPAFARTTATAAASPAAAASHIAPPPDLASMKAEITDLQSETTSSLDRAIAVAQAATSVGTHVSTELQGQREQMGHIDADARDIDADLKRTAYNLKHGFTWRGALMSPFRRASKKPSGAGGGAGRDVSPVFRDDYQNKKTPPPLASSARAGAPPHGGISDKNDNRGGRGEGAGRRGLFGSSPRRNGATQNKGARNGGTASLSSSESYSSKLPEHVPEGFEKQLDDLDGLLDGLNLQAKAIGTELRQQNEGIEALGARVEPMRAETASQAQQIKRRFRVKG